MTRLTALLAPAAVLIVLLSGCAAPAPEPTPTPTPTEEAEVESTVPPINSLAELTGTRWLVDDSTGDRVAVSFEPDGSISYGTDGQVFAYPEDTWTVEGETVTWQMTFGARFGIWTCVGTFDADTQLITGTWTSTSAENGTFEAKQPVR